MAGAPSNNGFSTRGGEIVDASGASVRFRGANLPSLIWDPKGELILRQDLELMASWGANVVRVGLNQRFWLAGGTDCAADCYRARVDEVVGWAHAVGLPAILDLHWSDAVGLVEPQFLSMPDADSARFWSSVAERYQHDPLVLFELYNEPHDIDWVTWRDGGTVTSFYDPDTSDTDYSRPASVTYVATGMQALYAAVRGAGATNVVIAGGLDWAFDLSGLPNYALSGTNVAYATHLYPFPGKTPEFWDAAFGFLHGQLPVLVTEFGPVADACDLAFDDAVLAYADARSQSWTAWAWFASGADDGTLAWCGFPAMFYAESDPTMPVHAVTPFGAQVRAALAAPLPELPNRRATD